jgi:hypothetical protein
MPPATRPSSRQSPTGAKNSAPRQFSPFGAMLRQRQPRQSVQEQQKAGLNQARAETTAEPRRPGTRSEPTSLMRLDATCVQHATESQLLSAS